MLPPPASANKSRDVQLTSPKVVPLLVNWGELSWCVKGRRFFGTCCSGLEPQLSFSSPPLAPIGAVC